jgi:hypothetical protein
MAAALIALSWGALLTGITRLAIAPGIPGERRFLRCDRPSSWKCWCAGKWLPAGAAFSPSARARVCRAPSKEPVSDKAAWAMSVSIRLCLRKAGTLEDYNVAACLRLSGIPFSAYIALGAKLSPAMLMLWATEIILGCHTRCGSPRIAPLLQGFRLLGLSFGEGDEKRGDSLNSSVSSAAKVGRHSDHYSYPRAVPSLPAFGGGKKPKRRSGLSPLQPCRDCLL